MPRRLPGAAILVDECYFEYAKETVCDHIEACPNIFITRTFSKTWGLASLRIGYLITAKSNVEELLKVRGPYDVNVPAVIALEAALGDPEFMRIYTEEVIQQARPFFEDYLSTKGIPYIPTRSNFILTFPDDAKRMEQHLRENGILVRPRSGPGIDGSLRFSIGTLADMERVVAVLDSFFL